MKLPESWREIRLTPLLTALETGGRPSGGVGEIESGIPSISGEHFDWNGNFDFSSIKFIPHDYFAELLTGRLNKGDVLIVKDGATTAKCSIVGEDFPYKEAAVNEHIFLLRTHDDLLDSRFLYELLRSEYGRAQILKSYRGAAIGGIPRGFADHVKLPLPTLPEQQRIVDVVAQANDVTTAKQSIGDLIDQLVRTAYWQRFGDWYTADGLRDPVRIADYLAHTQYGVSESMEDRGTHAVLRMNSLTTSGWLDLSDLKYANITTKDAESTRLQNGDLLFNRTNSKELVGKCAIWREVPGTFSFASYLVRLRLRKGMLPEYLWATLNSAYGKYRLLNAAKQAVSMANVSPTDLGRITVPLPPLHLQEAFARFVRQVESLRSQMLEKLNAYTELRNLVTQQALIGELTADWRDQHRDEITQAAQTRDALLRERGVKPTQSGSAAQLPAETEVEPTTRPWLHGELSDFQRAVLAAFLAHAPQPLLAEVEEEFDRFRESDALAEKLADFPPASPNQLRRALSQLAALGLIAKVTMPRTHSGTGAREYLTAFRPLKPGDQTRPADVALMAREIHRRRNPSDEGSGA